MNFIKRHKLLCIFTLLLFATAIYITIQRSTFAIGGELFLPLFPIIIKGLTTTWTEFKEEI